MPELLFYHLTESTLEEALPPLLEKSLQRGWRAVVQLRSPERRDALDTHLWIHREDSFIPHGTDAGGMSEHQPVLLTTGSDNPNSAVVRFLAEGAGPPPVEGYERVVVLFDGHDGEQLETARRYWKDAQAAGCDATYWQQTAQGRWARKA